MLVVRSDGEVVAGLGMNYRQLALPDGQIVDAAIFTAAWTLPAHRGRWHFSRLIRAARVVAVERGCTTALSFVTADNASAAVLRRAGAYVVPTFYVTYGPHDRFRLPATKSCIPIESASPAPEEHGGTVRVHYSTPGDWHSQILSRPGATECLIIGGRTAVAERVGNTERLQYVSGAPEYGEALLNVAHRAAKNGHRFFHFTMSEGLAQQAEEFGMTVKNGNVMILALRGEVETPDPIVQSLTSNPWHLHGGDRM